MILEVRTQERYQEDTKDISCSPRIWIADLPTLPVVPVIATLILDTTIMQYDITSENDMICMV